AAARNRQEPGLLRAPRPAARPRGDGGGTVNRALRCADCRELLGGYVLHALEPDDAEAVRAHLRHCDRCAAEHGELTPLPAMLDLAGSADAVPERPPAALEEAVLDRFARESAADGARARWRPRPPS